MNAAFDLLPLLLLAVLPMLFIVQFFNTHSRRAAWAAPSTSAPSAARQFANVTQLDTARDARNTALAA